MFAEVGLLLSQVCDTARQILITNERPFNSTTGMHSHTAIPALYQKCDVYPTTEGGRKTCYVRYRTDQ